ncbi:hypothetical protein C7N43_28550 [Sphingobacteriales bacterium UPWRP_1]|nr:hypothetical protein B6N25_16840 [Sphingobacteriales bacterium TSM_CSS]PSJ73559.1 hypothetical protein C7N43_28550 [Sphingobacteriales bacterium UPWRP_1]
MPKFQSVINCKDANVGQVTPFYKILYIIFAKNRRILHENVHLPEIFFGIILHKNWKGFKDCQTLY